MKKNTKLIIAVVPVALIAALVLELRSSDSGQGGHRGLTPTPFDGGGSAPGSGVGPQSKSEPGSTRGPGTAQAPEGLIVEEDGRFKGEVVPDSGQQPLFFAPPGSPASWQVEYEGVAWEELVGEAEEIYAYVEPQTRAELNRRLEAGEYELLATDGQRRFSDENGVQTLPGVGFVTIDSQGQVRRYQVPEHEYPDLYELAKKEAWLRVHAARRKAQVDATGG